MSAKAKTAADTFLNDLDDELKTFPRPEKEEVPKKEEEIPKKEEEIPKKEEEEEEPIFQRTTKKEPKSREESIAELRKKHDELKETSKVFTELFGNHKPQLIKPLLDFITEGADGPLTEEYVNGKLQEIKSFKEREQQLHGEIEEREKRLTELDIRTSKEFKEGFERPYMEAMNTLFLEFATVAEDKSVVAPKATQAFQDFLTTNPDADGITVKQKLLEFRNAYKAESGEDPTLPSVTSLMGSLRLFNSKRKNLQDAYSNWQIRKKEEAERLQSQQQQQIESQRKANKRARVDFASKAYQDFDIEETPFIKDDEIKEFFKEEFTFGEAIVEGKDVPEWDVMMTRGVKARLWDKYLPKLKELMELEESIAKGERNHIPGRGFRQERSAGTAQVDWLGEPVIKK